MLRDMTATDLDEVARIEREVHAHPWTRGNFGDALASGYVCKVLENDTAILGYVILMPVPDDMELLDIAVAAGHQRRGMGRLLLEEATRLARAAGKRRLLLEVRPSNAAALKLYGCAGFRESGRRRGYYPAGNGREDAIMMEYEL